MAHPSGICKYKDCDKPSVAEGYCAFHYDVISKQETRQLNTIMLNVLSSMNERLQSIEEKIANQNIIVQNSTSNDIKQVEKQTKQKPSEFIPSVSIGKSAVIKDMKTGTTTKNINDLADQLKATGG